jgi:hypothetical protein
MPFEIHEEAFRKATEINVMRPQEAVPDPLPDNWSGTPNRGLPVRQIPHNEYPRVVYKHPKVLFKEKEHRNANFELVYVERIPTEHKSKLVKDEEELKQALAKGWRKDPYIPAPPPKPDAGIYDDDDEDVSSLPPAPKKVTRGTAENPL